VRKTWLSMCAVALLLAQSRDRATQAADAKPVLVASIASLDKVVKNIDTLGEIAQSSALTDIVKLQLQAFSQGIDKKRPSGVVVMAQDATFDGYGFIPVSDFKALINTLGGEETTKGVFEISKFDRPLFAKEQKGWAFIAAKPEGLENLPDDPAKLLSGQEKEYDIAVRAYARNVPEFWRTLALQQLTQGVELADRLEGESEDDFEARKKMAKTMVQQLTKFIEESETLTIGWTVDEKAKRTFFEVNFTAIAGSDTAKSLAYLGQSSTNFAGFVSGDAAVTLHAASKFRPSDAAQSKATLSMLKDRLLKGIDESNDLEDDAEKAAVKKIVGEGWQVLEKTIEGGVLDGAGSLHLTPDSLTVLAGAQVADGAKLESVFKQVMELAAKKEKNLPAVKYDADSHKGVRIHTMTVPVPDEQAVRLLGEKTEIAYGFSDKAVYLALGKECLPKLKEAMDQSAAQANKSVLPMQFTISLGPILKVAAATAPNPVVAALGEDVSKYKGKDRLIVSVRPVTNGVAYRYEIEQGIIAMAGKAVALFGLGGGRGF
jgi:hypothetical protein